MADAPVERTKGCPFANDRGRHPPHRLLDGVGDALRAIAFASFIILPLALAGCGGSEEREAKHLARGKALFEAAQLEKSRVEFKNALKINPNNTDALYHIGLIFERNQNLRNALVNYAKVVQIDPKHVQARVKLGQLYLVGGSIDKAEEQARLAAELSPDDPQVLNLQAALAVRRGDDATAVQMARAALERAPASTDATVLLATISYRAGDVAKAFDILETTLTRNPGDPALRLLKIRFLADQGRDDQVIAELQSLIAVDPQTFAHRASLARALTVAGRVDEAEAVLRQAIKDDVGRRDANLALVDLLAQRRGVDAARQELQQLIEAEPRDYAYAFKLAEVHFQSNAVEDAKAVLRRIIDADGSGPNATAARVTLARLLVNAGETASAEPLIGEALKADPANTDALVLRATIASARGDHASALADARTVLRHYPDSPAALRLQAEALFRTGDTELALQTMQRLIDLEPGNTELRLRLATLLAQRGQRAAALKILGGAADRAEPSSELLALRASLLIDDRQWTEAETTIRQIEQRREQHPGLTATLWGTYHQARGDDGRAIEFFKQALAEKPEAVGALTPLVRSFIALNRQREAIRYLEEIVGRSPAKALAYNLMGELHAGNRDAKGAETAYRQAIEVQPEWAVPYLNLMRVLNSQGRGKEALSIVRRGAENAPEDVAMSLAYASALETAGDIDAAIDVYGRVLGRNPDLEVAINNFGALISDYRYEDRAKLKHALELASRFQNSTNALFVDTLGWLQYRSGDLLQARANLERAVKLQPQVPQLQYHLGMVLRDLGEKELARRTLERAVVDGADYPGLDVARATLKQL